MEAKRKTGIIYYRMGDFNTISINMVNDSAFAWFEKMIQIVQRHSSQKTDYKAL
jgi:hypothetical protein